MGLLDRFKRSGVAEAKPSSEELCTVLLAEPEPEFAARILESAAAKFVLLQTELVPSTFVREKIDVRFAKGVPDGEGHVRVSLKNAAATIAERKTAIETATALAAALMHHGGIAVVIHQAGEVKYSPQQWTHRTQLLGEPGWHPTLAWTDIGNSEGIALTYGLKAFGLPEVGAPSEGGLLSHDEAWARAQEALQAAACAMVERGAPLKVGETLKVIAGTEFSGAPLKHDNLGLDEPTAVHNTFGDWEVWVPGGGKVLGLRQRAATPLSMLHAMTQSLPMPFPYPSYRWLFIEAMRARGFTKIAFIWPPQLKGLPPHEVMVFEGSEGRFIVTTCGLGRIPQPSGTDALGNRYIEFAVQLPEHSPKVANAIAFLSIGVHGKDKRAAPIAQGHRVQTAQGVIAYPYDWVVLDALEPLRLSETGQPISLYQPLFMSQAERDAVPADSVPQWIAEKKTAALRRWLHPGAVIPLSGS